MTSHSPPSLAANSDTPFSTEFSTPSDSDSDSSLEMQSSPVIEQADRMSDRSCFLEDPEYQHEYFRFRSAFMFKNTKVGRLLRSFNLSGKTLTISMATLMVFLWAGSVLLYSQGKVARTVANLGRKTNIIVSGTNVSLNAYSPSAHNFTMSTSRLGKLMSSKRQVTWLSQAQYPANSTGAGFYQSKSKSDACVIAQIDTNYKQVAIHGTQFQYNGKAYVIDEVTLSPALPSDFSSAYDLVRSDVTPRFRSLSIALYWLYQRNQSKYIPIRLPGSNPSLTVKLEFAKFSPLGDLIIFGYKHDIYIHTINTGETARITNTGSSDVFNGVPDWVYEEEVLRLGTMFWWSPNQENLVFASINDTKVGTIDIDYVVKGKKEIYDGSEKTLDSAHQYPLKTTIKYPKPGTNNPIVTLYNYKLSDKLIIRIKNLEKELGDDFVLYYAEWIDNNNLLLKQTDRTSTLLIKGIFDPKKADLGVQAVSSLNATKEYGGWFNVFQPLTVLRENGSYIDRVVVNGRDHLALFDNARSPTFSRLLTNSAHWDILESAPIAYDATEKFVFTLATIRSSMDAHLIGIDLLSPEKPVLEITLANKDGYYELNFSPDAQYLDLTYSGPNQPWQKLINIGEMHDLLAESNHDSVQTLRKLDAFIMLHKDVNHPEALYELRGQFNLPTRIFKTVKLVKSNLTLNVMEILPPNFNPNRGKHPLLVSAYGGPGFQNIYKKDEYGFHEMISSCLDAVVLVIDPRGTGGQGWKFKSFANGNIGHWEARDIVTVVSDYVKINKFIDAKKTAMWGWSYGGFTTLKTLEYDAGETFRYGVAVAPVTNWMFYDSIYTERYMGLPSVNTHYETDSKIIKFENFEKVTRFMIMHGTADDNVHLQNLLWLLDRFDLAGVENYDIHFFPDCDHSIYYHGASKILFDKLYRWLQDAFSGAFENSPEL